MSRPGLKFSPASIPTFLFNVVLALITLIGGLAVVATVTGFFGEYFWFLDLTSHFRLLYIYILSVAFVILVFKSHFKFALLLMLALLVNAAVILPLYFPASTLENTPQYRYNPRLTLLQTNIWTYNEQYQKVADYVNRLKPDLWAIEEYELHHRIGLAKTGVLQQFPYSIEDIDSKNILFSRYPLHSCVGFSPKNHNAILIAQLQLADKNNKPYPLTVFVVHPERPNRGPQIYNQQVRFFESVVALKKAVGQRAVVVMGDFNSTPWSYPFSRLLDGSGLINSQLGYGVEASYPRFTPHSHKPFPMPLLPIDHALINENVIVLDRHLDSEIGSDHLPLVLKIALK